MANAGLVARFMLERPAFQLDCRLALPASGFSVLFGRSGCGKTTLLRCIAGLQRAGGEVHFRGATWQDEKHFLPTHRRPLAYVFQEPRLFPHLDVQRNLAFGLERVEAAAVRIRFEEAVAWLGLAGLLKHKPSQLSGGQQQRVAIARALLANPSLLLMDEPLASLDPDSKAEILPYLERLRSTLNLPVIYVTHSPEELARLADHLVLLDAGRVRAAGPAAELLTRTDLPLAHLDDAGAVLDARITTHDDDYRLSQVEVPGGLLSVALSPHPVGSLVRVRILARDVSITLTPEQQSSIQNRLPARVVDITADRDASRVLVRLDLGGTLILSRITRRAADQLALAAGMPVHAQIKAVALMRQTADALRHL